MLSVVIPVYNVAPYLQECVDSVLSQRFTDFEVLLVDDGSTDGSGAICDELAQKDPRVVVLHQENGGACSARNCGIDHARGEFLVFVDADDILTEDHLGHLMESDADMVVAGLKMFGAKGDVAVPAGRDDFGIDGLAARWNTPPDMNMFFSEDICFNMRYFRHAETFTELPYADYLYRITAVTRDEKYKMSASDLIKHHAVLESCFDSLYERIGADTLPFVRDNTNWRMMRKLYAFLMKKGISSREFVRNVKLFRQQEWSGYMMGLLRGKKEKRVMQEAVRFPLLTYWAEVKLQQAVRGVRHR